MQLLSLFSQMKSLLPGPWGGLEVGNLDIHLLFIYVEYLFHVEQSWEQE